MARGSEGAWGRLRHGSKAPADRSRGLPGPLQRVQPACPRTEGEAARCQHNFTQLNTTISTHTTHSITRIVCPLTAAAATCRRYDPAVTDLSSLKRLLTYSRRFVQTVHIRQLPSHLDLQILFECMVK